MLRIAKTLADNRPGTIVWCMGQTQHHRQRHGARFVHLATGAGQHRHLGRGANIFRGHDNVQGATDVGPNPDLLPGYYGPGGGPWKHFANAWGVDFEWDQSSTPGAMTKPGMTVSRWIDGVLEKKNIDQARNLRGALFSACAQLAKPVAWR